MVMELVWGEKLVRTVMFIENTLLIAWNIGVEWLLHVFTTFFNGNILDYHVLQKYEKTFEQIWGIEFVTTISNLIY